MNSKVHWDPPGLEDTTNRTLSRPPRARCSRGLGGAEDERPLDDARAEHPPQQYYSPLAKRNAGAIWIDNTALSIEIDRPACGRGPARIATCKIRWSTSAAS